MTEVKKPKQKKKDRSNIITLTERHVIQAGHPFFEECQRVCRLSKNLYNATLHEARQSFFKKDYRNYNAINLQFTKENQADYRALPAKVAKQTQMMVDKNFKSFFALKKKEESNPFIEKPRIPKYLKKDGYFPTYYEKGALSLKRKGFIKLSQAGIEVKTAVPVEKIASVRVVPVGNHFVIEVCYDELKGAIPVDDVSKVAFIDPGLNNLLTVTSNAFSPIIINGKPMKSVNHYYNKQKAKLQAQVMNQTSRADKLIGNVVYQTPAMQRLSFWRSRQIDQYFHTATTLLVNQFVSHQVKTVVFGHNKGQKQDINLGKKTNQQFVQLPFTKLIHQLKYKCALKGIHFVESEESYTSKASFLDQDLIPVYKEGESVSTSFSGKRVKRGLYQSKEGHLLNADVNGSLNIGRKYLLQKGLYSAALHQELVAYATQPKVVTPTLS